MNCKKIQKTAVPQILDHCGRSDSERSCFRSNQSIDPTRSHLNYNLAAEIQPKPPLVFHKERLNQIYVHGNASVTLVNWIVTAPQTLPEEEHKDLFKACFDKWKNDYGEENIVSAYVHLDETTPHMHFCFIPVVKNDKGEKLCAKEVITRNHLQKAHDEMEEYVSACLGHHVDILNDATREGNKSLADFKRGKAKEDLENAKKEADKIVAEAEEKAETIAKDYKLISDAYKSKEMMLYELEEGTIKDKYANIEEHLPTWEDPNHYYKVPADVWENQAVTQGVVKGYSEACNIMLPHMEKLTAYEKANKNLRIENLDLTKKLDETKKELNGLRRSLNVLKTAFKKLIERIPNFSNIFYEAYGEAEGEKAAEEKQHTNAYYSYDDLDR